MSFRFLKTSFDQWKFACSQTIKGQDSAMQIKWPPFRRSARLANQTISASEINLSNGESRSELSDADIFAILGEKVRRGRGISAILAIFFMIGLFIAVLGHHHVAWAILCGIGFWGFGVCSMLAAQKLWLARIIATQTGMVYWAHPRHSNTLGFEVFVTFYSRTGHSIEVPMSQEKMLLILGWLKRSNPGMRYGAYDDMPDK